MTILATRPEPTRTTAARVAPARITAARTPAGHTALVDGRFAEIVDALTRRGLLAGLAGGAALAGLAACGTSSPDADGSQAPTRRVVHTIHGDVDVPADPKRIVAGNFPQGCTLLDLGITPVGRPNYMPDFPAYDTALKDVAVIDDANGTYDLEKIAALAPDLIVTSDWADPARQVLPYDKLTVIAPTAVFTWEQAAGNWRDQAADTAEAVNRSAALTTLRQRYTDRAAAIKAGNAALFGRTRWDVIDCFDNGWDLYSAASSHGGVLAEAGVPLAAGAKQTSGYQQYSFERFDVLAGTDVIVTTTASLAYLNAQATFAALPAVKAGRVYATDRFFPASYGIALGLLDDLATICAKAAA